MEKMDIKQYQDQITLGTNLNSNLFSDLAEKLIKEISRNSRGETNKTTQLRKFYDELVMWADKVGEDKDSFKKAEPFIQMIRAKAAYAKGRKYIDYNFYSILDDLIRKIKDPLSLQHAKLFFEAMLGYKKALEK